MEKNLESIIGYLSAISNSKNVKLSKKEMDFIVGYNKKQGIKKCEKKRDIDKKVFQDDNETNKQQKRDI
jgi:hypothetical protein